MPRPEIDVVAWKPSTNQLLIIECKSYLDSTGVRVEHLHGRKNDKFKLFNRGALRARSSRCSFGNSAQKG